MPASDPPPLRLGVLGCAAVVDYAILAPAREDGAIVVAAVASRDAEKAAGFAELHGIPQSYGSYADLIRDAEIDAIYVALPNSLHHDWSIAALRAGHPVLCEKPLASNAGQAAAMVAVAETTRLPLVEAFHWRYHPHAGRLIEIVRSGELGRIRRIDTHFHVPQSYLEPDNIRLDAKLGGGSMMDQGCYCLSLLRAITGSEPEIVTASAERVSPEIDGAMHAELRFPEGLEASIACSMNRPGEAIRCGARITGEFGMLETDNPFMPGWGSRIIVTVAGRTREEIPTTIPSYTYQARAFAGIVRSPPPRVPALDSIANMRAIDNCYLAAGMRPRTRQTPPNNER